MDEEYDVIVCGTGLQECILSGLLSTTGKKVLHLDRNSYYGGESASLNLTNLYQKFRSGQSVPECYGANRDWNVDLIPKFVMACGKLVKILLRTKVTKYLEWQVVEGTYVYQYQKPGLFSAAKYIHKVPATDKEALGSPLMGILEKNRCKNFFQYCTQWDSEKQETWKGFHPDQNSMQDLYEYFNLSPNTIDFVGHAVALYRNDDYISLAIRPCLEKIRLYMYSISRYGRSPFIYPLYGLGGLPEGFSRLCAIHGGTYMLNKHVEGFVFDSEGKVCGVRSTDGTVARCKMVVCDPSYVRDPAAVNGTIKIKQIGQSVRCLCILDHPIPDTNNGSSCQVIIPQKQVNRNSDIYITLVSYAHGVAARGKYIASISTTVETSNPFAEIEPALNLLGDYLDKFVYVSDLYQPTDDGTRDNVFVSPSFDATSHFESASDAVLRLWKQLTGSDLNLTINADPEELQEM